MCECIAANQISILAKPKLIDINSIIFIDLTWLTLNIRLLRVLEILIIFLGFYVLSVVLKHSMKIILFNKPIEPSNAM